jgi:hypothetical protein
MGMFAISFPPVIIYPVYPQEKNNKGERREGTIFTVWPTYQSLAGSPRSQFAKSLPHIPHPLD